MQLGGGFEGGLGLRMIEKGCHMCGELDEGLWDKADPGIESTSEPVSLSSARD